MCRLNFYPENDSWKVTRKRKEPLCRWQGVQEGFMGVSWGCMVWEGIFLKESGLYKDVSVSVHLNGDLSEFQNGCEMRNVLSLALWCALGWLYARSDGHSKRKVIGMKEAACSDRLNMSIVGVSGWDGESNGNTYDMFSVGVKVREVELNGCMKELWCTKMVWTCGKWISWVDKYWRERIGRWGI